MKIPRVLKWVLLLLMISVALLAFFLKNPVGATKTPEEFVVQVSSENLEKHVRYMADNPVFRNAKNIARLNEVASYIENNLKDLSYTPEVQTFEVDGQTYKNIIVRLGAGDRDLMVFGAHYDACFETPGADDNASGVSGVLEMARLLKSKEDLLKGPVELVFYSLEEPPYFRSENMGSYFHAQKVHAKEKVGLMVSVEMIGHYYDERGSQKFPLAGLSFIYPMRGNFIGVIDRPKGWWMTRRVKSLMKGAMSLPIESINSPTFVPGIDYSDHLNYWNLNIPAVMITDTSFMRNEHYHKLTDTSEKINYLKMAEVVKGLIALAFGF